MLTLEWNLEDALESVALNMLSMDMNLDKVLVATSLSSARSMIRT